MKSFEKNMTKAFGGKTYVITGAAGELGVSMAGMLSEYWGGALLLDTDEVGLASISKELGNQSPNVVARTVDLTSEESIAEAFSDLPAELDPPDFLINSAGLSIKKMAGRQPLEDSRRMMEVNYFAVVQAVNTFMPKMLERRSGHIVTLASGSGVLAQYGGAGYAASRFAAVGYMEALRQETAGTGVDTHCILLPPIATEANQNREEGEVGERAEKLPTITPNEAAMRLLLRVAVGDEVVSFGPTVEAGLLLKRLLPGVYRTATKLNGYVLNRQRGRV